MTDNELEAWGKAWRDQPAALVDLKRVTRRERSALIWWIAGDISLGLALLALGGWLWLRADDQSDRFVAMTLLAFTLAALSFLVVNWRHSFRRIADSAREHICLQRDRARARLRYAEFSWVLLAVMGAFVAAIMYMRHDAGTSINLTVWKIATVTVTFLVGAGITLWIQVSARRRLRALDTLARTLEAGNDDAA